MRQKLATLISGGGTTMREIIKACQSGRVPIDVSCVIASNPQAGGIEKARKLGIPEKDIIVIDPNNFKKNGKINQKQFGDAILKELKLRGTTVVTQNGWLPLTPGPVVEEYSGMIFNQHPGPVPEFGGKGMFGRRVHAARLLFIKETGRDYFTEAVIQRVALKFDEGAVVKSRKIEILPTDSPEDLQAKVLPIEYQLQIELLEDIAKGRVKEQPVGSRVLVRPEETHVLCEMKRIAIKLYPHG